MSTKSSKDTHINFRRLHNSKLENPQAVILLFFENYPLNDCYDNLWKLFKGFVHSDFALPGVRNDLLFYEELEELIEAIFLLHQKMIK